MTAGSSIASSLNQAYGVQTAETRSTSIPWSIQIQRVRRVQKYQTAQRQAPNSGTNCNQIEPGSTRKRIVTLKVGTNPCRTPVWLIILEYWYQTWGSRRSVIKELPSTTARNPAKIRHSLRLADHKNKTMKNGKKRCGFQTQGARETPAKSGCPSWKYR